MLRRIIVAGMVGFLMGCVLVAGAQALGAVTRTGVIVFSARGLDLADLYLMDVERGTTINLTRSPRINENTPIWSPDGTRLLYNQLTANGQSACVIRPFESTTPVCIDTDDPFVDHEGWSSDGQVYYAYLRNRYQSYQVDPSSGALLEQEAYPHFSWRSSSRDGRYQINLTADDRYQTLMLIDGQNVTMETLVEAALFSTPPVFSADGTHIAFAAIWGDDPDLEIYTINTDGSDVQQLTINDRRLDEGPTWSPDGQQIVFISDIETGLRMGTNLYLMNADGTNLHRLTDNDMLYREPDWMP